MNYNIHALSRAISPISHMRESAGNESIINREAVLSDGKLCQVPVLSGNAIRHRMIRAPGALYLVKQLGLAGKLNIDQANYLFNGGSLTESSTTENLRKIADMQRLLPLMRLLGGSLKNQIIGGSLIVKRGVLVCKETIESVASQLPKYFEAPPEQLRTCEDFISQAQYTRGDATKRVDAKDIIVIPNEEKKDTSNLMIYNGQTVKPGALFYHGFVLQNVATVELGALVHSLNLWQEQGGTLGGQSRIGHGLLDLSIFMCDSNPVDIGGCVTEYIEHVESTKKEAAEWLNDVFKKSANKNDSELPINA